MTKNKVFPPFFPSFPVSVLPRLATGAHVGSDHRSLKFPSIMLGLHLNYPARRTRSWSIAPSML